METTGFFQYGVDDTNLGYEFENYLVGDRDGLNYLRQQIDQVIGGLEEIQFRDGDPSRNLGGIRCAQLRTQQSENGFHKAISLIGCALVLGLLATLVVLGLWKASELGYQQIHQAPNQAEHAER